MTGWTDLVARAALDAPSTLANAVTLLPHQHIPAHGFIGHVLLAGRGAGKSKAAMHWLHGRCEDEPGLRARIIAPTSGDGVASCVEGVDGLLELSHHRATFNPSAPGGSCVTYPNGSKVWVIGTPTPKDVDRLRALSNINCDVYEEAAANPQLEAAVHQASLSRRRGEPRWVATTTPRPLPVIKKWLADPNITVVRAKMSDNPHLPQAYLDYAESLKDTLLYRQEVLGEVVDDVEGALWAWSDLERSRVTEAPDLERIAIGVDPAVGTGTTGIVVVGIAEGVLYVLEDASVTDATAADWTSIVSRAWMRWDLVAPTVVVAEDNQGGRLVGEALQAAEETMPVKAVTSRVSKSSRAYPVAILWEVSEQRAHIVGSLPQLESQCAEWVPGSFSPDRIDALVHASAHLRGRSHGVVEITGAPAPEPISLSGFRRRRMGA